MFIYSFPFGYFVRIPRSCLGKMLPLRRIPLFLFIVQLLGLYLDLSVFLILDNNSNVWFLVYISAIYWICSYVDFLLQFAILGGLLHNWLSRRSRYRSYKSKISHFFCNEFTFLSPKIWLPRCRKWSQIKHQIVLLSMQKMMCRCMCNIRKLCWLKSIEWYSIVL